MKISASILDIKEPKQLEVMKLSNLDIDYIHLDVMDGVFVENKTLSLSEFENIIRFSSKPIDVHLMVSDVKKYIDDYFKLNPEYITFHYEAVSDVIGVINYIKEKRIKVGLSIKPNTEINEIINYLNYVDLVLLMSVEPGRGGQSFIGEVKDKIDLLHQIKNKEGYNFIIEVDGGINNETIKLCKNADMCVVGSYITKNDYEASVSELRKISN